VNGNLVKQVVTLLAFTLIRLSVTGFTGGLQLSDPLDGSIDTYMAFLFIVWHSGCLEHWQVGAAC